MIPLWSSAAAMIPATWVPCGDVVGIQARRFRSGVPPVHPADSALIDLVRPGDVVDVVAASENSAQANPHRQQILLAAWQFALSHPEMSKRVGWRELELPGRRIGSLAELDRDRPPGSSG